MGRYGYVCRERNSRSWRWLAAGLALVGLLFGLASCTMTSTSGKVEISLGQAILLSESNNISEVVVDSSNGIMTMEAESTGGPLALQDVNGYQVRVSNGESMFTNIDNLNMAELKTLGFVFPPDTSTIATSSGGSWFSSIVIFLIPILLFIGIFWLLRSRSGVQNQAMGFARSRARLITSDRPRVTFADVADAVEAKEDLMEVVEFLRNRWKFRAIGARIPKGVLLVGPPGTGKTLLARAIAGEAGVPFFSVSGSEFVEMYVGVGAARVRDMFSQAKNSAPCIIFIDEIDAIGRVRSGNMPGGHEEREQTLNQILVEMDGFDPNIGVIVLAATNRADILDPALLRPGRFDRRVIIDRPDTHGRLEILEIHSRGKALEKGIDLGVIAIETHGFSGADLANLMNEAAIMAVRRKKEAIGMDELEEAIDRVIAGPERKSLKIKPRDKELTAYHESGHALVAHVLPNVDPVHKISIVARGTMGGYTRLLEEDRYFVTRSQFQDTLATFLAGYAAEELVFREISTGPHSDLRQATDIATKMVTDYGMSQKLGLRTYGRDSNTSYLGAMQERDFSDEVARDIDMEVAAILNKAHQTATEVLRDNLHRLRHLAEKLMERESLEGAELEAAFTEPLDVETGKKLGPVRPEKEPSLAPPQLSREGAMLFDEKPPDGADARGLT